MARSRLLDTLPCTHRSPGAPRLRDSDGIRTRVTHLDKVVLYR
jgi:hypothetical protein